MTDEANLDFDRDAAWYRRFTSDAESNLRAFALRLHEAMPERVIIHENKPLFSRTAKTTGVSVDLDEKRYTLKIESGRLQANIAMVVRGITLNTKNVDPAEWFVKLAEETKKASEHAKSLSRSLAAFMAS
jgi:hypothetical protein